MHKDSPPAKELRIKISEVQFAVDKVAEGAKLSGPVFCHNDPHNGNIMIDRDENGAMVPETLVLFDFDNAGWGHRIWINNFFLYLKM